MMAYFPKNLKRPTRLLEIEIETDYSTTSTPSPSYGKNNKYPNLPRAFTGIWPGGSKRFYEVIYD